MTDTAPDTTAHRRRWIAAFLRIGARTGRGLVISIPYIWLLAFFLTPFLIVLKISFAEAELGIPPFSALLVWSEESLWPAIQATLGNYAFLFEDDLYWRSFVSSLRVAGISTAVTLAVGFPLAYGMSRAPARLRPLLVMLIILPFWTSFLIRVYAWIGILKSEGLLNLFLMSSGIISAPLTILYTDTAVCIGIVYSYLPFMVLPLYATLERMDESLLEAAYDLGCRPWKAFWKITVPLAVPGIVAGCLLVFIPAVGEFVIPDLLGGSETLMIGRTLWVEFFTNRDWPLASAVAIILLLMLVVPIVLFERHAARTRDA